ncbi:hypothetical protein IWW50_005305 [Coemansia erecta]|nr:hypothetical protein GGF43_006818 [Coemansia sp. RSA 2618]KAJ2819851.1 hypothetical protein IWW50_005305 [Coemansia erecta]
MDSESSYWDLYLDDTDYISPALAEPYPLLAGKVRGLDDSGSSRDSYWSRYSVAQGPSTDQSTPRRAQQRRLLVVPDRLAALHLSSEDEDEDVGAGEHVGAEQALADCGRSGAGDPPLIASESGDAQPLGSPCGKAFTGVNPLALITRLTFLKDQMEQNERLQLNPVA